MMTKREIVLFILAFMAACWQVQGQIIENWAFHSKNIDNKEALVQVNLDFKNHDSTSSFPILIRLYYESSLIASNRSEALDHFAEHSASIINEISEYTNISHVGNILFDNYFEAYYYVKSYDTVASDMQKLTVDTSYFNIRTFVMTDPFWEVYAYVLFPDPQTLQCLYNEKQLLSVEQDNDLKKLAHWIYFSDSNKRKKFIKKIVTEGFEIAGTFNAQESTLPFGLKIIKYQALTLKQLCNSTDLLISLSGKYGGEYDGWSLEVN